MFALKRLNIELKEIVENPIDGIAVGPISPSDLFEWEALIRPDEDSLYAGGCFKVKIKYSEEYPMKAPIVIFSQPICHPNVYPDGKICMSILHNGADVFGYEELSERWSPIQSTTSILLSLRILFSHPNFESPANVDVAKLFLDDIDEYKRRCRNDVEKSLRQVL
eukprot:TRINITY_DN779954_c0_g1_i1.p1 TRINITY_DN779954_c0_g1~~TRINITY_DN779954_c0_g1_i1.p1  ORF type:complete len:165 (+),score=40.47 TRINITY_DN779954_c0_g1_i1:142-636(+)